MSPKRFDSPRIFIPLTDCFPRTFWKRSSNPPVRAREWSTLRPDYLSAISWVFPNRPLTAEVKKVVGAGYLRGADLWHVACALFVSPDPSQISFLTLDARQKEICRAVGFQS